MARKKPKLRILKSAKQKLAESERETDDNNAYQAGEILIYNPIVQDAIHIDDKTGKMYLCLGEASSDELGKIGDALHGMFSSLRIVAVLGEEGLVDYFLDEELMLAEGENE